MDLPFFGIAAHYVFSGVQTLIIFRVKHFDHDREKQVEFHFDELEAAKEFAAKHGALVDVIPVLTKTIANFI